jgi:transposase
MEHGTTFVGIDAHKKDLFVAMLIGAATTPVTWQLANEPGAVRRMMRKLERAAPGPVHVLVDDYQLAIDPTEARLLELDARLAELAEQDPYRAPVGWLRCFRRIDTLTAMLILAELHDFRRFGSARALMAFLGLVPGENSTGDKHRRGRITKMGNALVRRVLIEASWHYQHRPGVGRALKARRTGQPARVIAVADKAQQRLCRRFRRMVAANKPKPKIAVAVARELAGFIWAALQPVGHVARS